MGFDLNSIGALYSGEGLSAISERADVKKSDVAKVLSVGIPALVGGMNRNAADADGAESLAKALAQHEAADISNPSEFLAGSDAQDGAKILGHVLGSDEDGVMDEISRASGVSSSKVSTILALAAPLLLSMLGQQNSSSSAGTASSGLTGGSGLLGMLGGLLGMGSTQQATQQTQQSSSSGLGLLGSLLGGGGASSSAGLFSSLLGGGSSSSGQTTFTLDNGTQQTQQAQDEDDNSGFLSSLLNLLH